MAKGVEDTAFYRWQRFVALNEVGGDPARFGITPEELHAAAERTAATWPATMTTLSTHDTKRSEDARTRLLAAVEDPERWVEAVRGWHDMAAPLRQGRPGGRRHRAAAVADAGGDLAHQRGAAHGYLEKATREAKLRTTWTSPDEAYEAAVAGLAAGVLADPALSGDVAAFVEAVQPWTRAVTLAQKALQLVLPGVPDVYQGTELVDRSLVDPDNRRPVDYDDRRARLAHLDGGGAPRDLDDEKLLLTSRALRLRAQVPAAFVGPEAGYSPVATSTGNAFALARGPVTAPQVVLVVTRRPGELDRLGGWGRHTVSLPEGRWVDVLSGTGTTAPSGTAGARPPPSCSASCPSPCCGAHEQARRPARPQVRARSRPPAGALAGSRPMSHTFAVWAPTPPPSTSSWCATPPGPTTGSAAAAR
jgi:(1->4)-alpha-D-glucan 1-alpha-D-glucosylmutase